MKEAKEHKQKESLPYPCKQLHHANRHMLRNILFFWILGGAAALQLVGRLYLINRRNPRVCPAIGGGG